MCLYSVSYDRIISVYGISDDFTLLQRREFIFKRENTSVS